MRRPSPIPSLVAVIAAILATLPARAQVTRVARPACRTLHLPVEAASPGAELCILVEGGELSGLRWPTFTDYRAQVREFYAPAFALAWTSNGAPTPQARALVQALQHAEVKGLEPEDYDASRWAE